MEYTDGWPDVTDLPWQEIIRIRYEYEIDVLVATAVQRAVTPGLATKAAESFAHATTAAAAHAVQVGRTRGLGAGAGEGPGTVGAESVLEFARAWDEFDDWCGTKPRYRLVRPPIHGPGPDPWGDPVPTPWKPDPTPWNEVGRADTALIIAAADRLINTVGSAGLRRDLSAALDTALGSLTNSS